jgi:ubiquinone/menaquinone biosynthesis C-methylase UbiE
MNAAFDQVAQAYDEEFTFSRVGWLQRQQVWQYLEQPLNGRTGLNILELNCGTGEDAMHFAEKGHHVTATDISTRMLAVAQQKSEKLGYSQQMTFRRIDINQLSAADFSQPFDWVFSDFGGLNCVSPQTLGQFAEVLPSLLNPGGRFIAVVMPRLCLWENGYFLLKGQFRQAFRRNTYLPLSVRVGDSTVATWYYSPAAIRRIFQPFFQPVGLQPIGLCLPPSYMEGFFRKRPHLLSVMNHLEKRLNGLSITAGMADHFLIDFTRKP